MFQRDPPKTEEQHEEVHTSAAIVSMLVTGCILGGLQAGDYLVWNRIKKKARGAHLH